MLVSRAIRRAKSRIKTLDVNLEGYTVLTEVGSKEYMLTPLLASFSGADQVFAWTRDTRYGTGKEIIEAASKILEKEGISNVEFYNGNLNLDHLAKADVITNSGFLRPLNEEKLKHVKPGCVIPLMYEKWELRREDIDPDYCKHFGIKLAGTWENHPDLMIFEHVGPLAVKMAMNAGYEIYRNNILVWSNDHFGEVAKNFFEKIGANNVIQTTDLDVLYSNASEFDFIFISDFDESKEFGKEPFIDFQKLAVSNPAIGIVHLLGNLNADYWADYLNVFPRFNGKVRYMTYTLADVGINPFVDLQIAGFKVADCLLKGIDHPLVQPISF